MPRPPRNTSHCNPYSQMLMCCKAHRPSSLTCFSFLAIIRSTSIPRLSASVLGWKTVSCCWWQAKVSRVYVTGISKVHDAVNRSSISIHVLAPDSRYPRTSFQVSLCASVKSLASWPILKKLWVSNGSGGGSSNEPGSYALNGQALYRSSSVEKLSSLTIVGGNLSWLIRAICVNLDRLVCPCLIVSTTWRDYLDIAYKTFSFAIPGIQWHYAYWATRYHLDKYIKSWVAFRANQS